jgi:O-acetyl-ADP-ribose deacetylase (regulator of RNase III)
VELAVGKGRIELCQGDITELAVDAIVNAANEHLAHGGGVAGAISRKGGPAIQDESDRLGGCPVGSAVVTSGGKLKARFVIHAVGPRMGEGDEDRKLASATRAALARAEEKGLGSIAFPAISTGIFGYPKERCAPLMVAEAHDHLAARARSVERVVFCLFDRPTLDVFAAALETRSRARS